MCRQHYLLLRLTLYVQISASGSHPRCLPQPHQPPLLSLSPLQVLGQQIPEFDTITSLFQKAHVAMVPDVPLVGWDVALTDEGPFLLEMNISCNLFNGAYDGEWYRDFVRRHLEAAYAQHSLLLQNNQGSKAR